MKSKGLGDTMRRITRATGLKTLTDISMRAMGYRDCGCDKRRNWLNDQFPYKYN